MCIAAYLGKNKAASAAILYLIEGCLGYPVFAGGNSGLAYFVGPTCGYLMSYPLEAYLFGWLLAKREAPFFQKVLGGALIAYLQLGIGSCWLATFVGFQKVLSFCFDPFPSYRSTQGDSGVLFIQIKKIRGFL